MKTDSAGEGRLEARYAGESDFVAGNHVDFDFDGGASELAVALPMVSGKTLEHIRLILPFNSKEIVLSNINIFSDGQVTHNWDF
jgi:hypothetical protein